MSILFSRINAFSLTAWVYTWRVSPSATRVTDFPLSMNPVRDTMTNKAIIVAYMRVIGRLFLNPVMLNRFQSMPCLLMLFFSL